MSGISLYLGSGLEKNKRIIEKARLYGVKMIFTSLHIPEEDISNLKQDIVEISTLCKSAGISLIADVSRRTLSELQIQSLNELEKMGISRFRFDFGFEDQEIVEYSKRYDVMINASDVSEKELTNLIALGLNTERTIACHNYYPKINTGISEELVRNQNEMFAQYGIKTIAFIPGDLEFRHPLFEGLPTCENHRNISPIVAMNRLRYCCKTDYIFVGDVDSSPTLYRHLELLSNNTIEIELNLHDKEVEEYLLNGVFTTRHDYSQNTVRLKESRESSIVQDPNVAFLKKMEKGTVIVSNKEFGRYAGEIELVVSEIDYDKRYNIVGRVEDEFVDLLELIRDQKMTFCRVSNR